MSIKKTVSAIVIGLMALAMLAGAALAAEKTYELDVVGLVCIKDEIVVGSIFDSIVGVREYEMDHMNAIAVVTIEEDITSIATIDAKLEKDGYGINSAKEIAQ